MSREMMGGGVVITVALAGPYANNLHLAPDTSTPHHSIFTGEMLFLTPNQQCQSTEGDRNRSKKLIILLQNMPQFC